MFPASASQATACVPPEPARRGAHLRLLDERVRDEPDFEDEEVLVAALRSRDEAAFEHLVRENGTRLLGVARRILPEEADARDAVQDAFVSALRSIDRFEGEARFTTWLHRIVVNAALMKLRTRRRKPEQPFDDQNFHQLSAPQESPALRAEREQARDRLRRAVEQLPERHRRVIQLRDLEERDTRETAEVLAISPSAVKTRLHRAHRALRTILANSDLRSDVSEGALS